MKLFWNRRRTMHILPTQRNIQYKPCQTRDLLYRISARSETKDTSPVRCSVEAISDALNATKETTYNRKLELEQIWNCTYIYIYMCKTILYVLKHFIYRESTNELFNAITFESYFLSIWKCCNLLCANVKQVHSNR